MPAKLFTAPTQEPVTLDEIKGQLSITDEISDEVVIRRITEARQWAEEHTQRSFVTQVWDLYLDSWPTDDIINLPRGPVKSITSVKYIDANGAQQTIAGTDYKLSLSYQVARLVPAYGKSWPSARVEIDSIVVRYTAGYGDSGVDTPGPIREAIMLTVGHWIDHQPSIESGIRITRIPYAVEHLMQSYRVLAL